MRGFGGRWPFFMSMLCVAALAGWSAPVATAAAGVPVAAFGGDGRVEHRFGWDAGYRTAMFTDGSRTTVVRLLTTPGGLAVAARRLLEDGRVDPAFARRGTLRIPVPTSSELQWPLASRGFDQFAVSRLTSGGFQVAVATGTLDPRLALVRLTRSGELDTRWGRRGMVVYRIPRCLLLAAGRLGRIYGWTCSGSSPHVRRYTAGGTLDASWGSGGVVSLPHPVMSLVEAPDGSTYVSVSRENPHSEPPLMRIRPSGVVDTGFGDGGFTGPVGDLSAPYVVPEAVGRFYTVRTSPYCDYAEPRCVETRRHSRDGTLDHSFGDQGTFHVPGRARLVQHASIDAQGRLRIVATGEQASDFSDVIDRITITPAQTPAVRRARYYCPRVSGCERASFAFDGRGRVLAAPDSYKGGRAPVLRGTPAGGWDATFGRAGVTSASYGNGRFGDPGGFLQPDGRIVEYGTLERATRVSPPPADFILLRRMPSGSRDPSWGARGLVRLRYRAGTLPVQAFLAAPGRGRQVIVAAAGTEGDTKLLRLSGTGRLDRTFGSNGIASVPMPHEWCSVSQVLVARNGEILIVYGCTFFSYAGVTRMSANGRQTRWRTLLPVAAHGRPQIALDPATGQVVVAVANRPRQGEGLDVVLLRLGPGGAVSQAFGSGGGLARVRLPARDLHPAGLIPLRGGGVIVGANVSAIGAEAPQQPMVASIRADGRSAAWWGGGRPVRLTLGRAVLAGLKADGNRVLGTATVSGGLAGFSQWASFRLTSSGRSDATFGRRGVVRMGWQGSAAASWLATDPQRQRAYFGGSAVDGWAVAALSLR